MTEAELRDFIREMIVRFEKQTATIREEVRLQREEMRRHFAEESRRTDDLIAENQAQRAALFRILDRLDNGGAAPAA